MTSEEASTVMNPFDLLPDEIWLRIFAELPVTTVCLCRMVSKKWYYLSQDETLWQYYSSLLFEPGSPLPPKTISTLNSWERFYRLQSNWIRGTPTKAFNFKAHDTKVTSLKLRGNILITGSTDKFLSVWNIKTRELEKEINVEADIICVDFIEHKDVIACGSYYGDFGCKLFSLSTGKTLGEFREDHWIGTQCMDMNDEYIILGTYKGIIHVLSWGDGRKVALFHIHNNRVAGVRLLGSNTAMSVSSNGAIDIFSIATNELLYQYILPKTSINICSFDNNLEGRDVLCIAPSGSIFHIRWEDLKEFDDETGSSTLCEKESKDERIRKIFTKDPNIIYQNNEVSERIFCAEIDSRYNHGVIGSSVSFPPKGNLLIYNPNVNIENVGKGTFNIETKGFNSRRGIPIIDKNIAKNVNTKIVGNGTRGFNRIKAKNVNTENVGHGTCENDKPDPIIFNVLGIDEERVVAGCTRGWIHCFEFNEFNIEQEEKEVTNETKRVQVIEEAILNKVNIFGLSETNIPQHHANHFKRQIKNGFKLRDFD